MQPRYVRRAMATGDMASMRDFYALPRRYYETHTPATMPRVRILLLTATCNGFGDVVFAYKLRCLLKAWFKDRVTVHVATTNVPMFLAVGEAVGNLVYLKTRATDPECRKFRTTTPHDAKRFRATKRLVAPSIDLAEYDLYFVAPLVSDFTPSYTDVNALTRNSNRFNTFFFSEYNSALSPDILFPTGVGHGRLGLLFVDVTNNNKHPSLTPAMLKHPYSIIYIANTPTCSTATWASLSC